MKNNNMLLLALLALVPTLHATADMDVDPAMVDTATAPNAQPSLVNKAWNNTKHLGGAAWSSTKKIGQKAYHFGEEAFDATGDFLEKTWKGADRMVRKRPSWLGGPGMGLTTSQMDRARERVARGLQPHARGMMARKQVAAMRTKRNNAAISIQRQWRHNKRRRAIENRLAEIRAERREREAQKVAHAVVQPKRGNWFTRQWDKTRFSTAGKARRANMAAAKTQTPYRGHAWHRTDKVAGVSLGK